MALAGNLTRRSFVLLALAGCTRVQHDALPPTRDAPVTAPNRLRIVIFEMAGLDVPFHAGLIVHAGGVGSIYDPAGAWQPATDSCTREGEVIRAITPVDEEAYLARTGIRYSVGGWVVHLFDVAVSRAVAELALRRMVERPPSLPLHCSHNVSSVLAGLPGFDGLRPHRITADLLAELLARDNLTYTRRSVGAAQTG